MANTILLKRSSTPGGVPSTSDITLGELAINSYDGRLFTEINTGVATIVDLTQNDPITLSGDATGTSTNPSPGAGYSNLVVTLASVNSDAGTWGGADGQIPTFTVNAKGLVTAAGNIALDSLVVTAAGNTADITANAAVGVVGFSLTTTGVSAGNYGSGTAIPTVVVDSKGRVTSITTNAVSTSFSLSGTSGSGTVNNGDTLTFSGTSGVTATVSGSTVTIGTPQDVRTSASPTFTGLTATTAVATNFSTGNAQISGGAISDTPVSGSTGYFTTGYTQNFSTANAQITGGSLSGLSTVTTTGDATVGGDLTVTGNLTVDGTVTTINSTTITVDDKNLELGSVDSPTDTTADGAGITVKGATDKTLNWVNATDSWTSSENLNLATGKTFKVAGTDVLSATALGTGVTSSSLTAVGTIATGVWNGTTIAVAYGGTGATTAQAAMNTLAGATTSGYFLRGNGTNVVMAAIQAADIPTLNQNTTGSAATLTTGRTISLTGDVTYTSGAFDGSANVTGTATLANSGVTAGTYRSVTVDVKGRVTAGTNPTTLSGYGITDALSTSATIDGGTY